MLLRPDSRMSVMRNSLVRDTRHRPDMAQFRSFDTQPELTVRKLLHALGYRYRIHHRELPGRPDIVFARKKKAIFVHGCFWHRHPNCKRAAFPSSSIEYWTRKFATNVERDAANLDALSEMGWKPLVIWECEVKRSNELSARLAEFLGPPGDRAATQRIMVAQDDGFGVR